MATEKKAGAPTEGLPEVDILMRGLMSQPGVEGFMVFNESGIPLKWTAGFVKPGISSNSNPIPASVVHYASLLGDLTAKSSSTIRKMLGESEGALQMLRLRTTTNEIVVAPSAEATLVVLQRAHSAPMLPLVNLAEASASSLTAAAPAGDEKKATDKA